jgi:stage II sporulation protein P
VCTEVKVNKNLLFKDKNYLKNVVFKLIIICAIFIGSYFLGVNFGKQFTNFNKSVVRGVDTINYKIVLNQVFPVIDAVHNNADISFGSEMIDVVNRIFGFDTNQPISIVSMSSASLAIFYNGESNSSKLNTDEKRIPEITQNDKSGFLAPDESSITSDEGSKDSPLEKITTDSNVSITNQTKYKIDIKKLLEEPLGIKLDKKGPKVLIYHTHTSECYADASTAKIANFTKSRQNGVLKVGDELKNFLQNSYGYETIHNGTVHDIDFNKAYPTALKTVQSYMASYPSIGMVFDIHRDGVSGTKKLRPVTKIDGKSVAKIMFVIGTDARGMKHPQWRQNLKFALKLEKYLNSKYPNFVKPVYISANR